MESLKWVSDGVCLDLDAADVKPVMTSPMKFTAGGLEIRTKAWQDPQECPVVTGNTNIHRKKEGFHGI